MNAFVEPLDTQMLRRYIQIIQSHPESHIDINYECPVPPVVRVLKGELVHCTVCKGPLMVVQWLEKSPALQFVLDAWGT